MFKYPLAVTIDTNIFDAAKFDLCDFKRTAAAVRKVHCGCTSSQIWAEKNAVDFSQNLRRGRMRKGMLPCGNIPFDAWLFNF